ncbi:MAG: hydroxyacid dehydrogenase [Notoacmeibacter sp.]|nr:hydroxyacid dehydrogenase [Notoacmeibacter sp.]
MSEARPKVVISSPVDPDTLESLAPYADLAMNSELDPWSREDMIVHSRDAYGIIAFMTDALNDDFLRECRSLRIVACALKGYDNFDVDACTRRGVWLSIIPDLLTGPTADLTLALLLALSRNVIEGDRFVRSGRHKGWRPAFYGKGLTGTRVGILGMGALGKAVARRFSGFDCRTSYFDPQRLSDQDERTLRVSFADFDALTGESDVLVLALPLTPATERMVDHRFLSRVKSGCLLINPARGSLTDEEAVADALETGPLGGYAADVFAFEDKALSNHPRAIPERLVANVERTLFTPHLGSAIEDVRRAIVTEAALNIVDCIQGRRPRGAINDLSNASERRL